MALTVHVALDLGSDTVKIAYAFYRDGEHTGKIADDTLSMTAIPSVAYYDFDDKKWLYGDEVDEVGDKSFLSVVKICDLLQMLSSAKNESVEKTNALYYREKCEFPKFFFPLRNKLTHDMQDAHERNLTFTVEGVTPADVCERYFAYVYRVVLKRTQLLAKGAEDVTVTPCLVYPQFASKAYVGELVRIMAAAFGQEPSVKLSMAKALCAYAAHFDYMQEGKPVLVFNIGEDSISVVKVTLKAGGVAIDGADGHNDSLRLGGNDIDDAVAAYLDGQMGERESIGRETGCAAEGTLNAKQYLFVKDIKTAKIVLGMPLYERAFTDGVPVAITRDLLIQRKLTREAFCRCVGITGNEGVAHAFADYMRTEIARPLNADVKKIFLTGGPVETYGLTDYLRAQLPEVQVCTFEKDEDSYEGVKNDGFNILSHEDALYAPAVGCAVASLNDMRIDMVLALTYGMRVFRTDANETPVFRALVGKGTKVPATGKTFYTPKPEAKLGLSTGTNSESSAPMHIMSTYFSEEDIRRGRLSNKIRYIDGSDGKLMVTPTDRADVMRKLQKEAGLRVLGGDIGRMQEGNRVRYSYDGLPVRVVDSVDLIIGVEIDGEGYARAFADNDKKRNGYDRGYVEFLRGNTRHRKGERMRVNKRDIEFAFEIKTQLT